MKRFIISMLALAAIVGCSKDGGIDDVIDNGTSSSALVFTAMFDEVETSRVEVDNATLELSWSANDAISVFAKNAGNSKYTYTGTDNQFAEATTESGAALAKYYAVYPYSSATSISAQGVVSLTLPAEQTYSNASGSLGLGANTMVAVSDDTNLEFQNVCGYLRLNLWGDGVKVKSIKLEGNDNEPLAGAATINVATTALSMANSATKSITLNCGDGVQLGTSAAEATPFWFVVPAQEFTEGFTITITDDNNKVMTQSTSTSREVLKNHVHTMTTLKVVTKGENEVIFDAQFNLDGSATDLGKYGLTIQTKPGDGMKTVVDAAYPYGNVVNFSYGPSNTTQTNSYYLVDYSAEAYSDFRADLVDGFTMEVVASHSLYSFDPWMRMVSSNTFGIFIKGENFDYTLSVGYHKDDNNSNWWYDHQDVRQSVTLGAYYHYVYVYDADASKLMFYCNGVLLAEYTNITIAAGKRLAIGGYPLEDGSIDHPFAGYIAMARIYGSAMSATDAMNRYESLNIPAPEAPVTPLFDAKFNEDATATNVGSYTGLTIDTRRGAEDGLITKSVAGFGYVANFGRGPKNAVITDGYYSIDFNSDDTFKSKLSDGFTMEMVVSSDSYAPMYGGYARPFGSESFGVLRQDNGTNEWMTYWNYKGAGSGTDPHNAWWYGMDGYSADRKQVNVVTPVNQYAHILYVYNPNLECVVTYIDGQWVGHFAVESLYTGTRLAIGGYPMTNTDDSTQFITQLWNGNVAIARIYDETFTYPQANARYESMKSTISTLNAAQQ